MTGGGRGSRWWLVRAEAAPGQSLPAPRPYLTLAAHAEAAVKGLAGDMDPEQRALMERVYEMTRG